MYVDEAVKEFGKGTSSIALSASGVSMGSESFVVRGRNCSGSSISVRVWGGEPEGNIVDK